MHALFLTPVPITTTPLKPCLTTRRPLGARLARTRMAISPPLPRTSAKPAKHGLPSAFDWRNQWYPVIWTDDLTTAPHAFTLWGTPLVLFRDSATSKFIVFDDVCPHRAAPLSDGRLVETETGTQIQCGYHGWSFDSAGVCMDIPYTKGVPKKACMKKIYPTTEWNGLVFVWFGDKPPDERLLPVPDHFRVLKSNVLMYRNTRRRMPVSFIADVENVVDTAHANWVHHNTGQGHRSRIPRDGGIDCEWSEDGKLISNVIAGHGIPGYRMKVTYQPPGSVIYEAPTGFLLFAWHLPISHHECELFALFGTVNPTRKERLFHAIMPRWQQCAFGNLVLDGDTFIMQGQMSELCRASKDGYGGAWRKKFFLANGTWDSAVKEFHDFIDANAVGMPWERSMPDVTQMPAPRHLTFEECSDRLKFHTKDCASCSKALKWATKGLWTAAVVMSLGAVILISSALVAGSGVGVHAATRAAVIGLVLCAIAGGLGYLMMKLRKSLVYTTKAYDLAH